ncbi:MAG: SulP family inorganic anion transporter [Cyclobacteriaceae bacterium]
MEATSHQLVIPQEGIAGLKKNWTKDLVAGLVVFAVALPMCMAIAEASGFPATAAIYTSIIGGLIVTFFSGTFLAIKGAPAGLSTIALGCITTMSEGRTIQEGYSLAVAVIVAAGVIQILFGVIKAGALGDFFPASVVQGMLAALGIIIAIQQLPVALGVEVHTTNAYKIVLEWREIFALASRKEAIIAFTCLGVLFTFNSIKKLRIVPAPLLAVVTGVILGNYFGIEAGANELKDVGDEGGRSLELFHNAPIDLIHNIQLPDFSALLSPTAWEYILLFAFIGSIESLLSAKAIDKMDPYARKTNLSKDLLAIGIGNVLSGMVGGLSMISASKRGAVNVTSGGRTRWSNFFHALFMFGIVLFAAKYLKAIPLSALASILIFSGINLVRPSQFFKVFKVGAVEFVVYFITMLAVFFFGLIYGILIGVVAELIFHLFFGVSLISLFKPRIEVDNYNENTTIVAFKDAATFSNYLYIKTYLNKIPKDHNIVFDFAEAIVVDHSFLEHVSFFEDQVKAQGRQIEVIGMDYHNNLSDHPLSSKRIVKGEALTPRQEILKELAEAKGMSFDSRVLSTASKKFENFVFSKTHKMNFEENVLRASYKEQDIEFSDIMVEVGRGFSKRTFKMTIMHIFFTEKPMPDLTLEKEGFMDSIIDLGEYKDIDFDEFPKFSNYYLLKGPEEEVIRKFFNSKKLRFFEDNRGNNMESVGNELLIYRKPLLLTDYEIEELLHFGLDFMDILFPDEPEEEEEEETVVKRSKSFFAELEDDEIEGDGKE